MSTGAGGTGTMVVWSKSPVVLVEREREEIKEYVEGGELVPYSVYRFRVHD